MAALARAKMFGVSGIGENGKYFAMVHKGKLVVKLPGTRVAELVASGRGEFFDPGHGRTMKEWAAFAPSTKGEWLGIVREARRFVASVPAKPKKAMGKKRPTQKALS
ncbi:MAG: hypothetical protein FJ312_07885 [SAR202 cluster bacterium]|nr:hypothetical protein [SAR202 cluster bacterium]